VQNDNKLINVFTEHEKNNIIESQFEKLQEKLMNNNTND